MSSPSLLPRLCALTKPPFQPDATKKRAPGQISGEHNLPSTQRER
jgi:hypothetical protein